ncbi:hypothetical protein [Nostoc sp. FACHB-152]|uniref:hypothetical protein n=1 Tax=Nostoc sp. FACHB-152 TaxID=2692837 RepID=UPI0016874490|nr:hypothetical protein [Nostoc sp. FACHB-152]
MQSLYELYLKLGVTSGKNSPTLCPIMLNLRSPNSALGVFVVTLYETYNLCYLAWFYVR